ncbi:hypothetical protein V6N11_062438 [Hibiscus sabdariffa]|uniref:Caffeoyl-CoA O-methyltransferase n=1 Tax=Hibiscus sabdariffa TaxID=183260 RepID=A0ABR2PSN4_9ROSI
MFRWTFKPDKCKIALKLAIPRIKLMKNKREARFKQLKKELAELLESGKDQTARIRVEHAVNEEKTMAAYDLLEIYCELIAARMQMIESQKNCPLDLKEAISSVIFASARCEEIPELKEVTTHLTAKYGKDFASAALELRPDCGVGRLLVEKLSVKAPDGQTKLKILTAIAEEHNIKWDPESFGAKESKIYDDMLNGPNALLEAKQIPAGHPNAQASTSQYEQRPTGVQVPSLNVQSPKHIAGNDVPSSFNEHSSRSSPNPENFDYSNTTANSSISTGTYPPRSKTRETENQGVEFVNSSYGNDSASPAPRQHGNMELKDAAAAAWTAAESAERASMDARAAAEHLGNISQQHSMESNVSAHDMRDEEPGKSTGSTSQYEHLARRPVNNSFHGRNSTNCEQTDSNEQHSRTGETENGPRNDDKSTCDSSKSTEDTFNEKPLVTNQIPDAYSQRNSSVGRQMEHFGEVSMKRNSGNEMHSVNELHGIKNTRNVDHHEVEHREQSSHSSHSQSNTFRDDLYDNASAVFDDYGSHSEDKFDLEEEHKAHEYSMNFSSPFQRSPTHPCSCTLSWSTEKKVEPLKESISQSHIDDLPPTFDNYGPSSESEEEVDKFDRKNQKKNSDSQRAGNSIFNQPLSGGMEESKELNFGNLRGGLRNKGYRHPPYDLSSGEAENDASARFKQSSPPLVEDSVSSRSYGREPKGSDEVSRKLIKRSSYFDSSDSEFEEERPKHILSSTRDQCNQKMNLDSRRTGNSMFDQPLSGGMEESKEFNLGNLTGGFRNKGYRHPPYALSSGEAKNDASVRFKQSSPPPVEEDSVSSRSYDREPKGSDEVSRKLSKRASYFDSSDSEFEEERPKHILSSTQEQYNQKKNLDSHQAGNSMFDQPLSGGMEESKELNLGNLTGGIRNKGYRHPPYALSSAEAENDASARFKQPSPPLVEDSVSSRSYGRGPKGSDEVSRKLIKRASYFDSSDSEFEEERPKYILSSTRDQYNQKKNLDSHQAGKSMFDQPLSVGMEERKELNLGNLTGGLRNKGNRHPPPYAVSSREAENDASARFKQSSPPLVEDSVSSRSYDREPKGIDEVSRKHSRRASYVDSSDNDSEEERPKHILSSTRDQYNKMQSFEEGKRSTSTVPVPRTSDSDEDLPKTSSKAHSRTSFSHNENVSPSHSQRDSTLKTTLSSEPTVISDHPGQKNSSSRSSGADEALPMFQPQERNSDHSESFQHSQLASEATSKLVSETKTSSCDETLKMSEKEQPHTSVPEIVPPGSAERISFSIMDYEKKGSSSFSKGLLQSEELYQYVLETCVYPREPGPLKELRDITATHPRAVMATAPDAGQHIAMLLKLINAKRTIEVGVFTGYSLLLTALTIPEDGKIIAVDMNREAYEIGLPVIRRAGVENKINFIESEALPVLDNLLANPGNENSFDFAFVDADKINYSKYHERLMKLLKVGGIIVYDNTLWGGSVAMSEECTPEVMKEGRERTLEFNKLLAADRRVEISLAPLGDGITICRRMH